MKLHLPKGVIITVCSSLLAANTHADEPMYINLGKAENTKVSDNLITCDSSLLEVSIINPGKKALKVGDGDLIGYFETTNNESGQSIPDSFVTKFGVTGSANTNEKVSNSFKVGGDLEISGSGKVYVGGKSSGNFYAYLEANNVTINGTGNNLTANGSSSTTVNDLANLNLRADSGKLATLTMNGGAAYLCTYESGGGDGTWGPNISDSCKSIYITGKLEVNDGYLQMGYSTSSNNLSNQAKHFRTLLGGDIEQNGGTIQSNGKVYLGGKTITQTGGSMVLGHNTAQERLVLKNSTLSIKQLLNEEGKDNKSTLTISGSFIGTSTSAARKLEIVQESSGTIEFNKGVLFETSASTGASTITQSGGGIINLSGDFSSAVFDIEQSKGSINLKSGAKMESNILSLNTAATLNIAGTMTVNDKLSFNLTTPGQETAAIVMASGGNIEVADMTSAIEFNLEDAIISDMKMEALAYTAETGEAEYTYTIDLISGLSVADKAEFNTLIENGKLSWSLELPQALSESTITSTELLESGIQWSDSGDTLQLYTTWKSVPEPATATLSLLALATLAARRRRK